VGTEAEELIQVVAAMEDVGFSQSVGCLEVKGADRLARDDHIFEIRHRPRHVRNDSVGNVGTCQPF